jgi:hypothetical protein
LNDGVTGSSASSGDDDWTKAKDKISTISALRAANRALQEDPLDVRTMDPALVVYRFDAPYQQQQEQGEMQGVAINYDNAERVPFTVTLNKFNTVADHVSRQVVRSLFTLGSFMCHYHVGQFVPILIFIVVFSVCMFVCVCVFFMFFFAKKKKCLLVTDEFQPQIAPFSAQELELWHWILLQTRGVGFYNSNRLAGASQAHRHMQFIPQDELWPLRNFDAPHVRVCACVFCNCIFVSAVVFRFLAA